MAATPKVRFRPLVIQILAAVMAFGAARADVVRAPNTTLNLPADLPVATGYIVTNALGGLTFSSPMCTAFPPGETNRLYVVQRGGSVVRVDNLSGAPAKSVFMNLAGYLSGRGTPITTTGECGLLAMVFHPNYNQNGYFFLYYSISIGGQTHQRLARFKATGTPGNYNAATSADPATQTPLLTMFDEASNHNGGDMAFGADGYLYLSLGDEGGGGDNYNNARFINKDFWGAMLRLDVDNDPSNLVPNAHPAVHAGTYRIPADNPFIGYTSWHGSTIAPNTVRTEFYATGLRNPFRFTIDPNTGRIFLGDVGQNAYEEVDVIVKGGDYGWSWREGFHAYNSPPAPTSPPAGYDTFRKDPIYEYDHSNNGVGNDSVIWGGAVLGGIVYRGNQLPELYGRYLFGDYESGIVAALTEGAGGSWTGQRLTSLSQIVDFGLDPRDGEPLLCSLGGTIYKLGRTGVSGTAPPATLSATGAFSDLSTLTPNAGIVPYTPNVSFWSDYAHKSRWFSIPSASDTIGWSSVGNWSFPAGMVWIKHFDFETERGNPATRKKLETRFLVKTDSGIYGLSYRWRADQTDADLVPEEGMSEVVPGSAPAQTWRYPARSECVACHSAVGGYALSFQAVQMNKLHDYGGASQNQITALSGAGYFDMATPDPATLPALAPADDSGQSLEWRVRSYLSANCAQCHQPGGAAQGNWDARHSTPTDEANLLGGLLVDDAGFPDDRVVEPGEPGHSMLLKRMQGSGVARMPPLATQERDLVDEQLLVDWISSLPPRQPGALAIDLPPGSSLLVNEGAMAQIPISRTGGTDGAVGFHIITTDGTAKDGGDFLHPTEIQTMVDGQSSLSVPISISDPTGTNEGNEYFTVLISTPTGGATMGAVRSVTVRIVDSVDTAPPAKPSITNPPSGALVGVGLTGEITFTGTATDAKGVSRVEVKLNDDAVVEATLSAPGASSTNWSVPVVPRTGTNSLEVQSFDTHDNASPIATRTFTVTRPLAVSVSNAALGSVSNGYSPSSFREVGKSYTVTATPKTSPAPGGVFGGWSITWDANTPTPPAVPATTQESAARIGVAVSSLEKQTLTFIFREGLQLTASFAANPYDPATVAGTYNGLIRSSATLPDRADPAGDGTAPATSSEGYFTATVQSTGAFSAKLVIDGLTLNLAGAFDDQGRARFGTSRALTATVARPGKPSLTVKLDIGGPSGSTAPAGKITGTVTATEFRRSIVAAVSDVQADRAYYTGTTTDLTVPDDYLTVTGTAASPAGRSDGLFTVILPSIPLGGQPTRISDAFTVLDYPQGAGVGTLKVTKTGTVTLTGSLADGTSITASSTLSQDLRAALFAQLYSLKGFFSTQVKLDSTQAATDLAVAGGSEVLWSRPFLSTSHYYPYGWPEVLTLDLKGAKYLVTSGQSVMKAPDGADGDDFGDLLQAPDADGNIALHFTEGQLSEELIKLASVSTSDAVTKVPDNDPTFTASITRTNGSITGTVTHTDDTVPTYKAVIYQKGPDAGAYGFFLTKQPTPIDYTGESGNVLILGEP